jgi:hypothetical protein
VWGCVFVFYMHTHTHTHTTILFKVRPTAVGKLGGNGVEGRERG